MRKVKNVACDLVHFALGFLSYFFPFLIVIYFLYQVFEKEPTVEKVCDYLEFLLGLAASALIFIKLLHGNLIG